MSAYLNVFFILFYLSSGVKASGLLFYSSTTIGIKIIHNNYN
jgi:hypothetical protein